MIRPILFLISLLVVSSCTKEKVGQGQGCENEVSFSQDVFPLIQQYCIGCHTNSNGYDFTNYSSISANAESAVGAMRANGFQLMPQGGPSLEDYQIKLVECWIEQGKPNN